MEAQVDLGLTLLRFIGFYKVATSFAVPELHIITIGLEIFANSVENEVSTCCGYSSHERLISVQINIREDSFRQKFIVTIVMAI